MKFLVFLLVTAGLVVTAPVSSVRISEQSYYTEPAITAQTTQPEGPEGTSQEPVPSVTEPAQVPTTEDSAASRQAAIAELESRWAQGVIPGQGSGNSGGEEEDEVRPPGSYNPIEDLKVIFMGDSRMVALYCSQAYSETDYPKHIYNDISGVDYTGYVGDNTFVARGGEGIYWLEGVATGLAERFVDANTAIVLWFGVNDLSFYPDIVDRYVNLVNNKLLSYGIPIYYMEIGPCDKNNAGKNPTIKAFNTDLATRLDPRVNIIRVYSFVEEGLQAGVFATLDGLHYDYTTSWSIFRYAMDTITGVTY